MKQCEIYEDIDFINYVTKNMDVNQAKELEKHSLNCEECFDKIIKFVGLKLLAEEEFADEIINMGKVENFKFGETREELPLAAKDNIIRFPIITNYCELRQGDYIATLYVEDNHFKVKIISEKAIVRGIEVVLKKENESVASAITNEQGIADFGDISDIPHNDNYYIELVI